MRVYAQHSVFSAVRLPRCSPQRCTAMCAPRRIHACTCMCARVSHKDTHAHGPSCKGASPADKTRRPVKSLPYYSMMRNLLHATYCVSSEYTQARATCCSAVSNVASTPADTCTTILCTSRSAMENVFASDVSFSAASEVAPRPTCPRVLGSDLTELLLADHVSAAHPTARTCINTSRVRVHLLLPAACLRRLQARCSEPPGA